MSDGRPELRIRSEQKFERLSFYGSARCKPEAPKTNLLSLKSEARSQVQARMKYME